MATRWTLTLDCDDARLLAGFWSVALGYAEKAPPRGYASWDEWLAAFGVPEDERKEGASLSDPDGVLPSLSFLRVPEPKSGKNRLHLDLQVSGGRDVEQPVREQALDTAAARLVAAGATVLSRFDGPWGLDHVVMADPEGNEFCLV